MQALLVVDMQQAVFDTPRYQQQQVMDNINLVAEVVRNNGGLVIYIQHIGQAEDNMLEGSQGWQIVPQLQVHANDLKLNKTACDAFYNTELEQVLRQHGVDSVIICGAVTEFCVDTTLRSCLSKNFKVSVLTDGHTTADREHLSALQIITHHNWSWRYLILPDTQVNLLTSVEFIHSHVN